MSIKINKKAVFARIVFRMPLCIFLGQVACQQCGSSAVSVSAGTTCSCVGAHRVFSSLTRGCVCESGYTFFNQASQDDPQADSTLDCQLIVSVVYIVEMLSIGTVACCNQLTTEFTLIEHSQMLVIIVSMI